MNITQMRAAILCALVLVVTSCTVARREFPTGRAIWLNKTSVIIVGFSARNSDDLGKLGDNHGLYVLNQGRQRFERVLSYGRHLTVHWNPDQTCLAIIESEGSNRDALYIYNVHEMSLHKVNVEPLTEFAPDDHFRILLKSWNADDTVSLKLEGYGSREIAIETRCRIPFDLHRGKLGALKVKGS